ncbi:unnamed protein product [Meloidogyne enterolobii]|uniref:Uncharacterized protein n=1 Tax=Meloidogyne enterolobii TaxID=390850 RepID=A0ACB0Y705_MELEN
MRASSTSTTDTASEPCSSSSLIDEKKNEKKVHRYNVEVIASDNPKNGLNLNNGIIKHRDIAHLVCVAVNKANLVPSPHKYVYEGHSILYSSAELQMCDPISVSYSEVSESIQNAFGKKAKFHVIIKPCQTEEHIMNLNDLNQCETEDTLPVQEDRSLPTFFEFDIAQKTLQRL